MTRASQPHCYCSPRGKAASRNSSAAHALSGGFLLLLSALALCAAQEECPPPEFDSVADLDLEKYIAAPWYVQEQQPVSYQPENELYCVRAKYVPMDPEDPEVRSGWKPWQQSAEYQCCMRIDCPERK